MRQESEGKMVGAWVDVAVEAIGSNYRPGEVLVSVLVSILIIIIIITTIIRLGRQRMVMMVILVIQVLMWCKQSRQVRQTPA